MYRMLRLPSAPVTSPVKGAADAGSRECWAAVDYSPAMCDAFDKFAFTSEMISMNRPR